MQSEDYLAAVQATLGQFLSLQDEAVALYLGEAGFSTSESAAVLERLFLRRQTAEVVVLLGRRLTERELFWAERAIKQGNDPCSIAPIFRLPTKRLCLSVP